MVPTMASAGKHRFYYVEGGKRYLLDGSRWQLVSGHEPAKRLHIIPDGLDYVRHPTTGKRYTSKGKYVADTKAMGYEIIGNDMPKPKTWDRSELEPVGKTLSRKYDEMGGR